MTRLDATQAQRPEGPKCAVCQCPIKPGFLMCFSHWRMVPSSQAKAVLRTWGYWQHANGTLNLIHAKRQYLAAREAAINSVQQLLQAQPQQEAPWPRSE